uniref:Transposon Ty3-G Gag-Pol polyprotein n=1 Tax=Bactrocera dorsalis TaxID=27457 RepID=A0A034WF08_BACDO
MNVEPEGLEFAKMSNVEHEAEEREIELLDEFQEICSRAGENTDNVIIKELINSYKPQCIEKFPYEMNIVLSDEVPVCQSPRTLSLEDRNFVNQQVENWLEADIIQPSSSNYASPVVIVKRSVTKRLCCDYRLLNTKIVQDGFPRITMWDSFGMLNRAKIFTKLVLEDGECHVPIAEDSRKYTAFVTQDGHYEFKYVPFGIRNSREVFSRFLNHVFGDLIKDETIGIHMTDIIIPSKDIDEGIMKLRQVLEVASRYGVRIKWEKCEFLQLKIKIFGYEWY